jgi:uncharacterized oxidoreductase
MKTSGNTILITGGATGIGLALAEILVEQGNNVIVCGRRHTKLLAAKKKIPQLEFRVCDVSKPAARTALVRWLKSRFPALNVLINNAGIQRSIDFSKGSRDLRHVDEEIATNLAAPIHLAALLIPALRKRREAAIVNISSGLAFTPLAHVPVYCATKAALHSWSLSLRHQLRETSVRIFEIVPPMVATDLGGRRRRPEDNDRAMNPVAVAQATVQALENDDYEVAVGAAAGLREMRERLFPNINQ